MDGNSLCCSTCWENKRQLWLVGSCKSMLCCINSSSTAMSEQQVAGLALEHNAVRRENGAKKKRNSNILRTSLPVWTVAPLPQLTGETFVYLLLRLQGFRASGSWTSSTRGDVYACAHTHIHTARGRAKSAKTANNKLRMRSQVPNMMFVLKQRIKGIDFWALEGTWGILIKGLRLRLLLQLIWA